LSQATLGLTSDILGRVVTINPNGGTYKNVTRLQTVTFYVVVMAPETNTLDFGLSSNIVVRYVGFGNTATIETATLIQCIGCSATNTSLIVDLCGVCGGNGTLCLGCDGLPYPDSTPLKFDQCGVCGGNNDSCIGCDGVVNGAQLDACGICNGTNTTCVGCDGLANSGKVVDNCGVCGGNNQCQVTGAIVGLATVATVGIVAGIIAIIILVSGAAAVAVAQSNLVEAESTLTANPLYVAAKKTYTNPLANKGGN